MKSHPVESSLVIDAHVRLGESRDVTLSAEILLDSMDAAGVDVALVAPSEAQIAYFNREGNGAVAKASATSDGRLLPYAVATPWQGSDRAIDVLKEARDEGAVAMYLDPTLQGFDPFDGTADSLIEFAVEQGWFIYVRTGTPPHATPLVIASVARRHGGGIFLMGRSGATDFWMDVAEALRYAPNLFGETVYSPWDIALNSLRQDPTVGVHRVVFGSDSPYATQRFEMDKMRNWPIPNHEKNLVLGATVAGWLGSRLGNPGR